MKGLFINNKKAKDSIYESGYMVYKCLLLSKHIQLDYLEIDADNRTIPSGFDFYLFNYHIMTMQWLNTKQLKNLGFVATIVLEVAPNDPFVLCNKNDFDAYCVLDPTINLNNKKVFAFPRPLEAVGFDLPQPNNAVPVIGTFGFATKGKGFHHVVEAVNKEFDQAIVKINIPHGDFVPNSKEYAAFLAATCTSRAKPGVEVQVTHDFMPKEALIRWCANNDLNCFLYDRDMPGLAATTDQAIVSKRPLAISQNDTFRHILQYITPYPQWSLKQSMTNSLPIVEKILNDWSPVNFARRFEEMLSANSSLIAQKKKPEGTDIELAVKKNNLITLLTNRIEKYKRLVKKTGKNLKNGSKKDKAVI